MADLAVDHHLASPIFGIDAFPFSILLFLMPIFEMIP